jgi:hypothetical protein
LKPLFARTCKIKRRQWGTKHEDEHRCSKSMPDRGEAWKLRRNEPSTKAERKQKMQT